MKNKKGAFISVCAVKNCDILMNDAKENPTGFVAYLSYVRDLWGVSDKVSRKIAQFYISLISNGVI